MLAAFHVLRGHSRVNVLVDNLSLLERDFATFESLFAALGISSVSAASQQTVDASVQVDGLIVDEDVNRSYVYEDKRSSALITDALKEQSELRKKGSSGDKASLLNIMGPEHRALAEAVTEALQELDQQARHPHAGGNCHRPYGIFSPCDVLLDARGVPHGCGLRCARSGGPRGKAVQDAGQVRAAAGAGIRALAGAPQQQDLWHPSAVPGPPGPASPLDNRFQTCLARDAWYALEPSNRCDNALAQFLLSRPHVLKKHSRILGLSGSLGNDAEQEFVKEVYDCDLVLVPAFLDCCRGKSKQRPACRGVFLTDQADAHYQRIVQEAVKARDSGAPGRPHYAALSYTHVAPLEHTCLNAVYEK
eukprot:1195225-Prorocentrum_minimum.AAC.2